MINQREQSVVVIPTLKRPEFLALTLERLANAGAEHLDVRIFVDWGIKDRHEDVAYVRDTYLPSAQIYQANPHVRVLSGAWNILMSLKEGWETGAPYVFLVEEDVMVRPEFFEWHWKTQEEGDYFVTCGRKYLRMPLNFYSNPGTCYRHDKLSLVIPHINEDYFKNTEVYVDKHFPQYRGMDGSLDDGLIRKIQRSVEGSVVCAEPPVAHHQGFHYYNRMEQFMNREAGIEARVARLRDILLTVNPLYKYTPDFEPYR
jgi:hypothetical protein